MLVYVGLSGGVDSAVSAALLKRAGHEVVGCFIKVWSPEFIECTWREDRLDAMRVAATLEIPFKEIDLSVAYKKEVVEGMIADYARGITPNPDIMCNKKIKFGRFMEWALQEGAEAIATGHYARVEGANEEYRLLRGKDSGKDQSYFLAELTQEELSRVFFPIGEYTKSEVRAFARKFALPQAEKPDSQGLCFVGEITIEEFLGRYIGLLEGNVLDAHGNAIGRHKGAALYTLGQRHGFTVQSEKEPHYVVAVDTRGNTIRVSKTRSDAFAREIRLDALRWTGEERELPLRSLVQTRYREAPVIATISENMATFEEPHLVSPGQTLAIYEGDALIGSARIGI